ncbi:MAG: hypothetical protein QM504_03240 [Pseudomonadota bacterium]
MKKNKTIITIASQTGNVMKSTIAQALAVKLVKSGVNCKVACVDREHRTDYDFITLRYETGISKHDDYPLFKLHNANTVKDALENYDNEEVYIIDLPSRASIATLEAAKVSDHIIMPTCTGTKDIKLTMDTAHQLIEKGINAKQISFIITRYQSIVELRDTYDYIKSSLLSNPKYRVNILSTPIPEKLAFRRAIDDGFTIFETTYAKINQKAEKAIDRIIKYTLSADFIKSKNIKLSKDI